jgi:predicted RNase H-like HicB family nuclease
VTSAFNPDILTQADSLDEAFENARDVVALFREKNNQN